MPLAEPGTGHLELPPIQPTDREQDRRQNRRHDAPLADRVDDEELQVRQPRREQQTPARQQREREREAAAAAAADCHSSYTGACLDPNASDYDCSGGSGDGPEYTGMVTVVGADDYELDRDGDGTACDVS